ncbi:MAG TPA: universal stress protein [Candidatus Brocadiia bacterium]|nr:universal stress protein [Candidatus Brocadiia bacterium]
MANEPNHSGLIRINKILMPTDFSDNAGVAIPYALEIARRYNAELHIVTVLDTRTFDTFACPIPGDFLSAATQEADKYLTQLVSSIDTQGVAVKAVSLAGVPFVEIIGYARQESVDLIIVATHGRSGITHAILGSVTEKIVRKAPCPVLTVNAGRKDEIPAQSGDGA